MTQKSKTILHIAQFAGYLSLFCHPTHEAGKDSLRTRGVQLRVERGGRRVTGMCTRRRQRLKAVRQVKVGRSVCTRCSGRCCCSCGTSAWRTKNCGAWRFDCPCVLSRRRHVERVGWYLSEKGVLQRFLKGRGGAGVSACGRCVSACARCVCARVQPACVCLQKLRERMCKVCVRGFESYVSAELGVCAHVEAACAHVEPACVCLRKQRERMCNLHGRACRSCMSVCATCVWDHVEAV